MSAFGSHAAKILSLLILALTVPWRPQCLVSAQESPHQPRQETPTPRPLNITAISAANNASVFECWQFGPVVALAGLPGAGALLLGSPTDLITIAVFPPRTKGSPHNAPRVQFVVFLSGRARLTLPSSDGTNIRTADIEGGHRGVIVAADTADVSGLGHTTDFPSDEPTTLIQIPIVGGELGMGNHTVLHPGPCTDEETAGF